MRFDEGFQFQHFYSKYFWDIFTANIFTLFWQAGEKVSHSAQTQEPIQAIHSC